MSKFPPVIILAGGLGTRMEPLYPELPKAMIPVHGKPFIDYQLRLLSKQSIDEVILCIGHRCQPLVDYIGSGETFGINVRYSYDGEMPLGTGGAVYKAKSTYSLDGSFAVLYGDSYLDTDFACIDDAFQQSGKLAMMTVFKNKNQWCSSNVLYQSGQIMSYNKHKPIADMQHIDYGLSIFQPQAFSAFYPKTTFDLSDVFLALIKDGQLAAYEVRERFYEAGSPAGLKDLESYLSGRG